MEPDSARGAAAAPSPAGPTSGARNLNVIVTIAIYLMEWRVDRKVYEEGRRQTRRRIWTLSLAFLGAT